MEQNSSPFSILLVEDNRHIMEINRSTLADAGHRVLAAKRLAEARRILETETPDLLVLDVMLPDGDGVNFCAELRAGGSRAPVLFLTAKGEKDDILEGLRAGGDDYLPKPYDLDIFAARVQALLRRVPLVSVAKIGDIEIEFGARRATRAGADLLLTPKEFALLEQLWKNRGSFVPTGALYKVVWGMPALQGGATTVKEHVYRLRRKLGEDTTVRIETERGKGYQLVV